MLEWIPWIAGVIFSAGGAWVILRQTRKDLNGVSAREKREHWNTTLWIMANLESREDRLRFLDLHRL